MMHIDDYTEAWHTMDAITTVVEANGYGIYGLRQTDGGFRLELESHIDEEATSDLCGQFSLSADYGGEGEFGTVIDFISKQRYEETINDGIGCAWNSDSQWVQG